MLYGFLNFLDATNLTLTDLELSGVAPWAGIVYLVGALGPCLTQAARNGAGPARLTATALANGINPSERLMRMAVLCSCRTFPGSVRALVGRPEPYKRPPGWPG